MNPLGPVTFKLSDPPSVLLESLACLGYCIVDAANDTVVDAADVLLEWFEQPASVKQAAATAGPAAAGPATAAADAAAAAGRGFFSLPDKEVLEVKQHWRPEAVKGAVRLAAKSVSSKAARQNLPSNHVATFASVSVTRVYSDCVINLHR
jgi:hypothetical protein